MEHILGVNIVAIWGLLLDGKEPTFVSKKQSIPFPSDDEKLLLSISLTDLDPSGKNVNNWKEFPSKAQKTKNRSPPYSPVPLKPTGALPSTGTDNQLHGAKNTSIAELSGQPQQASSVISPMSVCNCGTTTPLNYYTITEEREQIYKKNTRKIKNTRRLAHIIRVR